MTTPILKTVEVDSAQSDKYVTINLQQRQTEGVSVRVLEIRTSAPPALGTDGASYIVGSGSISGAWVGYTLNDIAVDIAGAWYRFTPVAGWHVWNVATNKMVVFTGAAWVNQPELSTGVSAFTTGSIPFITAGTFAQDNANLSYDDTLNILKALRVAWSVTALSSTTTLGATHGRNINVSSTITLTLPAAATSAGVEYLISKTDSSATTVTIDANGAELINGQATTTLNAQYSTAYLICNGTGWNLFSSGGTAIAIADNTASAFSISEGATSYLNIDTTNGAEIIQWGVATVDMTVKADAYRQELTNNILSAAEWVIPGVNRMMNFRTSSGNQRIEFGAAGAAVNVDFIGTGTFAFGSGGTSGYVDLATGTYFGNNTTSWIFRGGNSAQDIIWQQSSGSTERMRLKTATGALLINTPNAANVTGAPQIIVSADSGTGVGRSDIVIEVPDVVGNTGGIRIANDAGGSVAGFSGAIVTGGAYPTAIGRGYFWAQNGFGTTTCGGWEADGAFYIGAPAGLYGKLTVAGAIAEDVSATITSATTINARTGSKYNQCSDAGGSFTITLPTAANAKGVELTFTKVNSSSNTITIDGSGAETIDSFSSLLLYTSRDTLTIWSDGAEWRIREYFATGSFSPTLVGSTTPGTHTYSLQLGKFTRTRHQVTINAIIELSAKDAAMAGNVRMANLPFTCASATNNIASGGFHLVTNVDLAAGFSQFGCAVVNSTTFAQIVQSGDNVVASNVSAAAISATSRLDFSVTYSVI